MNNQLNFLVGISDFKKIRDEYACPFFDIRSDNRRLFDGLEIIYDEALCNAWMNLFKELKSGSAGKIQVGQSLHTMSTALKDNTALRFAVITGCLKIAKESIFTGTNNFVSVKENGTKIKRCR